jgi:hypothetical protein
MMRLFVILVLTPSCLLSVTNAWTTGIPRSRSIRSARRLNIYATATDVPQTANQAAKAPPYVPSIKAVRQTALLTAIWEKIAFPRPDSPQLDFLLKDYNLNRDDVKGLLSNFQNCKDCAADRAFLMATQDAHGNDMLRLSQVAFNILSEEDSDDDWGNFDPALLGDDIDPDTRTVFPIENDDAVILRDTKEWVRAIIADFGICPFTIDPERAGIPMGGVRYTVSRAKEVEEAFYMFWKEVHTMLILPEKEISTVLLVFPEIELFGNFELFEAYCESLNDALCSSTMCMENEVQLVFFHPKYQFRDGHMRSGEQMGAANFARRGPWPMVNILRTPQVRAAQKGIPTGVVYKQNEERLSEVGTLTLERMLYDRNWEGLPAHSAHAKSQRAAKETAEKAAMLAAAKAAGVEVTTGVCPFSQAELSFPAPSVVSAEPESVIVPNVKAADPVAAAAPSSAQPTVGNSLLDAMQQASSGAASVDDFLRLAEEAEKWLAMEESQKK